MSADQKNNQRIFGAGMWHGLKLAGISNPGEFMKLEEAKRSLNAQARKVLDACPMNEAWSRAQIIGQLRSVGQNSDVTVVDGCLKKLKDVGLIREAPAGHFQQVPERPKVTLPKPAVEPEQGGQPDPEAAPAEPMDRLLDMAFRLREQASALTVLAHECEDIALAFEEKQQKDTAETAKLRRLQATLRELTTA